MTIFRVEHKKNYTVVNNFICKDKKISWKAKGIWLYAFSRPDDWEFNLTDLVNQSTDGKDSVSNGLKELENFGYLQREQKREDGKFSKAEWVFHETPQELKKCLPETGFPSTVNPPPENPLPENPPLLSTEVLPSTDFLSNIEQQQGNAAVSFESSEKEKPKPKPHIKTYECLDDVDIPQSDKEEICKRYNEFCVKNAVSWATHKDNPPSKCLAASIKFGCRNNLSDKEFNKKKSTPLEKIKSEFQNGEIYNGAQCFLTNDCIAFQRGLKHEQIKIDKFFTWKKLIDLCESFQIKIGDS